MNNVIRVRIRTQTTSTVWYEEYWDQKPTLDQLAERIHICNFEENADWLRQKCLQAIEGIQSQNPDFGFDTWQFLNERNRDVKGFIEYQTIPIVEVK